MIGCSGVWIILIEWCLGNILHAWTNAQPHLQQQQSFQQQIPFQQQQPFQQQHNSQQQLQLLEYQQLNIQQQNPQQQQFNYQQQNLQHQNQQNLQQKQNLQQQSYLQQQQSNKVIHVEVCQFEKFRTTCGDHEVVVMSAAEYGRMALGRCLKSNVSMGCHSNVQRELERLCSGRPLCSMDIPHSTLHSKEACLSELMAYLKATYTCQSVIGPGSSSSSSSSLSSNPSHIKNWTTIKYHQLSPSFDACSDHQPIKLKPSITFEFLSSHWMRFDQWGHCPFRIMAESGQRIVFYIVDYSSLPNYTMDYNINKQQSQQLYNNNNYNNHPQHQLLSNSPIDNNQLQYCNIYATITEHNNKHEISVCYSEKRREKQVVTTNDNVAVLRIVAHILNDNNIYFLLKFKAIGCPDIAHPPNGWLRRISEQLIVTCNVTGQVWRFVCKDQEWVGPSIRNLCHHKDAKEEGTHKGLPFPTYGLLTAVITGILIGALCGFSLLATVLWCKRRSDRQSKDVNSLQVIRNHAPPTELTDYDDVTSYIGPRPPHFYHSHHPPSTHCSPYHHYHHHHSQCVSGLDEHSINSALCTSTSPVVNNNHAGVDDDPQHQQQQLQGKQQSCKLKHKLENGEYGYTHVWQLENQQQQQLSQQQLQQQPIYSRQQMLVDVANKNNDISTFKPYSKANHNTTTSSNSVTYNNNNNNNSNKSKNDHSNSMNNSNNKNNTTEVYPSYTAVNKPNMLEHPSLLQDHVVKQINNNHSNTNNNNNNHNNYNSNNNNNISNSFNSNNNINNENFLSYNNEEYKLKSCNDNNDNNTTTATTMCEANSNTPSSSAQSFPKLQNYYA